MWAYQPVKKPPVPGAPPAQEGEKERKRDREKINAAVSPSPPLPVSPSSANPIDAFLAARLPSDLPLAPPADARTFIRRATFNLTGLPPTPEDVAAFAAAHIAHPQSAIAHLIDRLLASPHYGERMAQHWLDVVRYADSSGFANDFERGNAWRYRDYVVRAFNTDLPYDRFAREQIAGDELDPKNPETVVATGFLRMGPWELTGMEVAKVARQRFLDDVTNSVGETFLAQSLQCARCHDHKFDPVPTRDYYAIQATFATTQLAERPAAFLPEENTAGFDEKNISNRAAKPTSRRCAASMPNCSSRPKNGFAKRASIPRSGTPRSQRRAPRSAAASAGNSRASSTSPAPPSPAKKCPRTSFPRSSSASAPKTTATNASPAKVSNASNGNSTATNPSRSPSTTDAPRS
jgi:hypothetical protein